MPGIFPDRFAHMGVCFSLQKGVGGNFCWVVVSCCFHMLSPIEVFATEREGVLLALSLQEPIREPGYDALEPKPRTQKQARSIGLNIENEAGLKIETRLLRHSLIPAGPWKILTPQNV